MHQVYSISIMININCLQGLRIKLIDFDLQMQKSFGPGQIYTMLSRVNTSGNLYCIGEFNKSAVEVNKDAFLKYER